MELNSDRFNLLVIIPAHDEGAGIGRCLRALRTAAGGVAGELTAVVVCNGCSDNTAQQARSAGDAGGPAGQGGGWVRVVETAVASKSNALNLGDEAMEGVAGAPGIGVRFYVDADVVMGPGALEEVSRVLREQPGVLAAAPSIRFELSDRPWSVRAFYRVWSALPYCRDGMIGSGVYAVSEEGRKRWGQFPAITADDAFVRLHFALQERRTVESCHFTVSPPRSIWGVIKIKTRAHFGELELRANFPDLFVHKQDRHGQALKGLMTNPKWWPAVGVYLAVRMVSKFRGWWRFKFGDHQKWERDESSRTAAAGDAVGATAGSARRDG